MKSAQQLLMEQEIRERMNRQNYYQILDLSRNSSSQDIKRSYKKLALKFHPDKNKSEDSKQLFNKISEAYKCLSNQKSKQNYDSKYMGRPQRKQGSGQNMRRRQYNNEPQKQTFGSSQFRYAEFRRAYYDQIKRQQLRKKKKEQQEKTKEQVRKKMEEAYQKFIKGTNDYKKKAQEAAQKKERAQSQRRQRQKRKKSKLQQLQQNKKRGIVIIICVFIFYVAMGPILDLFKQQPIYSLARSHKYNRQMITPILNRIFYVNSQYFEGDTTQQQKQRINQIVNRKFILGLKNQCKLSKKNKQNLQKKSKKQKLQSNRIKYIRMAQSVNMDSCNQLFRLLQQHSVYLQTLKV